MKTESRRGLTGNFVACDLGSGAWQLTNAPRGETAVYLTGAESDAAHTLRGARFAAVAIEWRKDEVLASLTSSTGTQVLRVRSAIIHEPLAHLYESLPLVSLDDAARRFWRRVFRLVRIPGGRYLLGLIARRAQARKDPQELDHMDR
jgi:hypothetical protein